MATLEKIRSKSVLLLVVIGVALFAFIIGDFLNSGSTFFGNTRTIAQVGGQDIDVLDFQRRYESMGQQNNYQQDPAALQQQVLNQMIQETLVNEEMDALGLTVTDKELTSAMVGEYVIPQFAQWVAQVGMSMGMQGMTPQQLHDIAFNPAKYGIPAEQASQLQALWLEQENNLAQQLRYSKLMNLLSGAITANQLDAKALYDENASTARIAYVKKDLSALEDEKYPVSESEVKELWNNEKNGYRLAEETRLVNYITVNITPSEDDNMAAQKAVEEAIENLKANPGTEGVSNNINFVVERINQPSYRISNTQLKNFAAATQLDSVAVVSYISDEYTIAKLLGKKNEVDSINFNIIVYQGANRDSILNELNKGTEFASVATAEGVMGSNENVAGSFSSLGLTNDLKEKLLQAQTGRYFVADSLQGMIVRVNERKAPVTFYDLAKITYKVEPSPTTVNYANTALREFITANNSDTALTKEKAIAAGYQLLEAQVTASTPMIGNVAQSRNAVKWVMDADKGQVSDIFRDDKDRRLLAVAVTGVYEDFVPANDPSVYETLSHKVRNNKKAAELLAQYNGKATDLAGYAQLMETQVDTTDVTFGQRFVPGIGIDEATIIGQATVVNPNTLVGPVQANNSVVAYEVVNVNNENRPYNYEESAALFNQQFGSTVMGQSMIFILRNYKDIENNILNFYNN